MMTRPLAPLSDRPELVAARSGVGSRSGRRARRFRPDLGVALEGRALLSVSPLDPLFNGAHPIVNPATVTTGTATSLNTGSAIAIQPDNKIVVVGAIVQRSDKGGFPELAARRYNANGTVDTTFGTGGEADITLAVSTSYDTVVPAAQVLIQTDGRIVVAAEEAQSGSTPNNPTVSSTSIDTVVARLNADGSVDATFGSSGQAVISTDAAALTQIAFQTDGRIVLAGLATANAATGPEVAVTRLNTDGSVDTGFNSGNLLLFDPSQTGYNPLALPPGGLLVNATNNIIVAWTVGAYTPTSGPINNNILTDQVAELNPDGSLNTGFGTGGLSRGTGMPNEQVTAATLQSDGRIVLAGSNLIRLNTDGSADSTLTPTSLPFVPSSILVQADGKFVMGIRSSLAVARYDTNGMTDGTYGPRGQAAFSVAAPTTITYGQASGATLGLALNDNGQVVAVGTETYSQPGSGSSGSALEGSRMVLTQLKTAVPIAGDYTGAGKANIAAQLSLLAEFAIREAKGDVITAFGVGGINATIPAPGDYDGDGITDVAAYIPSQGILAYRPSSGGPDVYVSFGPAGIGASIPAPGDYDGDGITDVAIYIPTQGVFAIHPSGGGANYYVPFGTPGVGASIPAPGDYDGDGKTDPAVYLTATGTLAYRPSTGGSDVLTQFGPAGVGASIPAPGDYDGDGKTDIAVYLPGPGAYAIHPSSGAANYAVQFGTAGRGGSIPAPADYDGDGVTDLAVYIPSQGIYAFRPSAGGGDVLQSFGPRGASQTIPASSLPPLLSSGQASTNPATGAGANATVTAVEIPLTDDLLALLTPSKKKVSALA